MVARCSLKLVLLVTGLVWLSLPGAAIAQTAEYLTNPEMEALELPFSEAVRVDDVIFLSGQVGNIPGKLELVPGGIGPETRQTMENIRATLERHGSALDRVIKCTVFMADISEWPAMNAIYATYFPGPKPARSAAGANGLALGARVEIECIALAGDS